MRCDGDQDKVSSLPVGRLEGRVLGLQCHWPCWQVRPSAATRSRLALAAKLIEPHTVTVRLRLFEIDRMDSSAVNYFASAASRAEQQVDPGPAAGVETHGAGACHLHARGRIRPRRLHPFAAAHNGGPVEFQEMIVPQEAKHPNLPGRPRRLPKDHKRGDDRRGEHVGIAGGELKNRVRRRCGDGG